MVKAEIETARRLAQAHAGKPRILPVRVAFHEALQYPLSAYLNPIQWALWESEADTPRLISELTQAVTAAAQLPSPPIAPSGQADDQADRMLSPTALAQPRKLDPTKVDSPEGTIDSDSTFYVTRHNDEVAHTAIQRKGVTITIKGPRQMGKSRC